MPDLDRAKIDVHSLQIVEEYSNGQFKLGTRYIVTLVWNKISKLSINLDTRWGCRIVWDRRCPENISRGAFAENKLRNGLIKTVVSVGVTCSTSLSFTAMTSKTGAWSGLCQSPASIDISLCSGHVFVDYSSIIFPTVSSDLLHHWFERPPFGGRGSLERYIWIYSN